MLHIGYKIANFEVTKPVAAPLASPRTKWVGGEQAAQISSRDISSVMGARMR